MKISPQPNKTELLEQTQLLICVPIVHLGHLNTKAVEKETYLEHIINTDMADDDNISKEIRNIYARGNMLIRNFKHCTTAVKITLFQTYCSTLHCCPMWTRFRKSTIGKVNVACNKVFNESQLHLCQT